MRVQRGPEIVQHSAFKIILRVSGTAVLRGAVAKHTAEPFPDDPELHCASTLAQSGDRYCSPTYESTNDFIQIVDSNSRK